MGTPGHRADARPVTVDWAGAPLRPFPFPQVCRRTISVTHVTRQAASLRVDERSHRAVSVMMRKHFRAPPQTPARFIFHSVTPNMDQVNGWAAPIVTT